MNILSFADTRFPIERANGVQTMETCHALAARGHSVTLMVRPDTAIPARDPFAFYGLVPTNRLHVDSIRFTTPAAATRARMILAGMRRALTSAVDLVFTRDLGFAATLARVPAGRRPPLVYESHGVAAVVSAEMPTLLGRPGTAPDPAKLARLDRRDGRVWRVAEAYVSITSALAGDLAGRYGNRSRVFVVPDGARARASAHPRPNDGPLVAAYAGHLYPWKGVDIFVDALVNAPDVRGLIIGGHPGEADLARVRELIATRGLQGRVEMTGLLAPAAVSRALEAADILVLPNIPSAISDRFTSPLKLFEYLALGRAIVASDLPSLREILSHGVHAMLVPPGDAAALGHALTRLAADAPLRARLGAAAAALAPEYTWARRAERLEAAFAAAVDSRR